MQTNQSRTHPPTTSFTGVSYSGYYSSTLIIPGPGTRQLGTAPMPQSPSNLFKLASPKSAYPASAVPSHRNHNQGSCRQPLLLSLTPDQLWCVAVWPSLRVPSSPKLWVTNPLFNGRVFLICWPYWTSHFLWIRYILEQALLTSNPSARVFLF